MADVKAVFDYFECKTEIIEELTYSLKNNEEVLITYDWVGLPKNKTVFM